MNNASEDRKAHWDNIYTSKDHKGVSWYQESPDISLQLLDKVGATVDDRIIDIGAGASTLVDALISKGYSNISILDISDNALSIVKQRLGGNASLPSYYTSDVTGFSPECQFDIWHDRAVFHFLTQAEDRDKYASRLDALLSDNGKIIIGTFSLNGPKQCSGLDIEQYDEKKITNVLGKHFELIDTCVDVHKTPGGMKQEFMYFLFGRKK
ncbi:MAG: class I SAM-dependent methyltransferase [Gammaproteobacteria bacterium]|nr:class I SAM-dependent methyltransferase [Gammaproteobacteria bacterium]